MKRFSTLAIAAVGAVVLTMTQPGWAGNSKLGTVKIGAIYPVTGQFASSGTNAMHGTQLAVDILNGKYPNIPLYHMRNGTLTLDVADSESNAQTAGADVDRLASTDHVAAFIGAYASGLTLVASEHAERLGLPFINGTASAPALTQRGLKWFFRVGPTDTMFVKMYMDWLSSIDRVHPVKRVVVMYSNDEVGDSVAKLLTAELPKHGITVADQIEFQDDVTDLSSQVEKLRSDKPDAVFFFAYSNPTVLFYRALQQLNYTPPAILANGAGADDPSFVPTLKQLADDTIERAPWSYDLGVRKPVTKEVADLFQRVYKQPMTGDSARDFEAMMTLGQAIDQADSTDPAKIRAALVNFHTSKTIMSWKGIRFDANGQNVEASGVIEQMVNGKYHVIYPTALATAKVLWPMRPMTMASR